MRFIRYLFVVFVFHFIFFYSFAVGGVSLPSLEGTFGKWNVFTIYENGKKVCYCVSSPVSLSGNHRDNRDPYIMVSLFNGTLKQEISISTGYIYKANSLVSVSIDGKQERFIAESDTLAWVEKSGRDKEIIASMFDGFRVFVFAESYANTYSIDTYSLSGFRAAYKKASTLCSKNA